MGMGALLSTVVSTVGGIIDKSVTDKDEAQRIKAELSTQIMEQKNAELEGAVKIITAEAQGESWLQRNWRPILMLTIVAIVANNFIIAPYINALFGTGSVPMLDLPERLWDLMTVGVGGYVVGRSAEKGVKAWKGRDNG